MEINGSTLATMAQGIARAASAMTSACELHYDGCEPMITPVIEAHMSTLWAGDCCVTITPLVPERPGCHFEVTVKAEACDLARDAAREIAETLSCGVFTAKGEPCA